MIAGSSLETTAAKRTQVTATPLSGTLSFARFECCHNLVTNFSDVRNFGRGGKFNWYEGGARSAAFISVGDDAADLLAPAARGGVYEHPVHAVDWICTLSDLAGVPRAVWPQGDGLTFDGVSLVSSDGIVLPQLDKAVRTETLLSIRVGFGVRSRLSKTWSQFGVIRVGDFKLMTQDPNWNYDYHLGWTDDCLFGTGTGGWVPIPTNDTDLCPYPNEAPGSNRVASNSTLADKCTVWGLELTAALDMDLCDRPCSPITPCLYNVASDPQERHNLANQLPHKVAELTARLGEYANKVRLPEKLPDSGQYCETMHGRGAGPGGTAGWNGPWMSGD